MSGFERFHPAVLFFYYLCVLLFSMFSANPVVLLCVLGGGIFFFALLSPAGTVVRDLIYYFFMFLLVSAVNLLFSHDGETILFFMNDNPMTLEALLYGAAIAAMIVGIMFWCKAYQKVLTTDKFLYLFGKTVPKLSLVLSMALRFIPVMKEEGRRILQSQKAMGMYPKDSRTDQILGSVRSFDVLLGWSLEHAVNTADAMKARGYGLPGRTHFSLFRFRKADGLLLGVMVLLGGMILMSFLEGYYDFFYYPVVKHIGRTWADAARYGQMLLFLLLPGLLEVKEKIQWKYWKSRI